MINSRNKLKFVAALLGSVAAFGVVGIAAAQDKPKSLVPSFIDGQLDKPLQVAPAESAAPVPATAPAIVDAGTGSQKGVVIDDLGAVHAVSITLDAENSLGSNLWAGSDPSLLVHLMSIISAPENSRAAAGLFQNVMQTGGAISASAALADQVLDQRFENLLKAGRAEDVIALYERLPANARMAKRLMARVEADLLKGDTAGACASAEALPEGEAGNTFKSRLSIYCYLAEGDFDRADVKYALLDELGAIDPFFASLYSRIVGGSAPLMLEGADWSPLNIALYHLIPAKKREASGLAGATTPAAKRQIFARLAKDEKPTFELLRDLYNADLLSAADAAAKVADVGSKDGSAAKYLTALEAAKSAATDDDLAVALINLWSASETPKDYPFIAALSMPYLEKLTGQNLAPEFALEAVKASLISDRADLAQNWERAARRAVFQGEPESRLAARNIVSRIDMYMLISGEKSIAKWGDTSVADWMSATEARADQAAAASLLLSQMEVMGQAISDQDWQSLLKLSPALWSAKSNHSLENNLVLAASGQQIGATAMLALMMVDGAGPGEISLTSLRAVTAGLKAVGQEKVARRIALEAFLARNI